MLHEPFRKAELRSLLLEGDDYTRSSSYRRLCAELASDGRTRFPRCHSMGEIHAYFQGIYALYENMRVQGYIPSDMTGADGDIEVRISRSGQFLKCGQGTHRLAVARILGLSRVMVRIDLVHSQWLDRCMKSYQSSPRKALIEFLKILDPALQTSAQR